MNCDEDARVAAYRYHYISAKNPSHIWDDNWQDLPAEVKGDWRFAYRTAREFFGTHM